MECIEIEHVYYFDAVNLKQFGESLDLFSAELILTRGPKLR